MKNKLLSMIESRFCKKNLPSFQSGNLIQIKFYILEGLKKRIQFFKGIIISYKKRGINSSILVRKVSYNEGIEKLFFIYSPIIKKFIIIKRNFFSKSKLYYLRKISKKSMKLKKIGY